MSNIMLTKACNLNCKYCFANEFVNKSSEENVITIENFNKALDFITRTENHVGLIGGEPTTHPKFKEILEIIINNPRVKSCTVYTNGLEIDKFFNQLCHPKFSLLVNCNNHELLGSRFAKLQDNLDELLINRYMNHKVSLGINMYAPDFEYQYILDLCERYHKNSLRVSICVPNSPEYKNYDSLKWFETMKPSVFNFFSKCLEQGVVPHYDCNSLPFCCLTEEEHQWMQDIEEYANRVGVSCKLASKCTTCGLVLDILPDLRAVRCFGMSDHLKAHINDFGNATELRNYFDNEIDSYKFQVTASDKCKDCYLHKTRQCTGGCLAYKGDKIAKAREIVKKFEEGIN